MRSGTDAPAQPGVPRIDMASVHEEAKEEKHKDVVKSSRSHSSHGKLIHNHSTGFAKSEKEQRPLAILDERIDRFLGDLAKINVNDKDVVDLDQLAQIKEDIQLTAQAYEKRSQFKVNEEMSARKRQLDEQIKQAEDAYAAKRLAHDRHVAALDDRLTAIHQHITEVQGQTLINQLKAMETFQYYHNKVLQQIADIDASLDAASCCSKFFCCCFPSKEILQKQKQLTMLRDEQDAFASNDLTKVSQVLMDRIEKERQDLLKQKEDLANDQPAETAQQLRDERTKLQADIDANRDAYYQTINPQVMLNLVRLQSFLGRMQRRIENAKTAADQHAETIKSGLLHAALVIVKAFLKKFNHICENFVCVPPQNESNKISYAQYCDRIHHLHDDEKKGLIKGEADQGLLERIFPEHAKPLVQPENVTPPSSSSQPSASPARSTSAALLR